MFTLKQIENRYSPNDVHSFIMDFMNQNNMRYDSFDYCFGYFQNNKTRLTSNMEQSCMALWSYLASWGMLRGSSVLLQNGNYKALEDTVIVIQRCFNQPQTLPDISSDTLDEYVKKVFVLCSKIEDGLANNSIQTFQPSNTLITKIVLGVFGVFPALDQYFCKTFGGGTSIKGFAGMVWEFYHSNRYKSVIDEFNIHVKSFSGHHSSLLYPVAKLIDMFGFTLGGMVQGCKGQILINNGSGRQIFVNGIQMIIGKNNAIPITSGKHKVEVLFLNDNKMVWDKVEVKK